MHIYDEVIYLQCARDGEDFQRKKAKCKFVITTTETLKR